MKNPSVLKNYLYNTLLTVANLIFPILTFPYVNRIFGPIMIGKINFANSVINYLLIISGVGIPLYGVRAIAQVKKDKEKLNKAFSELLLITTIFTVICSFIYLILVNVVDKFYEDRTIFYILGITLFTNMFAMDWLYKGLEDYKYITTRNLILKIVIIVLTFTLIKEKKDINLYILLMVLSQISFVILNIIYLKGNVNLTFKGLKLNKHMNSLGIIFGIYAVNNLYSNLDKVVLGFSSGDEAVGIYAVAQRFVNMLQPFIISLGTVLLPRLSYYVKENNMNEYKKLLKKSFDYINFIAFPCTIGVFFIAKSLIAIFGGKEFMEATYVLKIFAPLFIILGFGNIFSNQILIPFGKEKFILYSVIISCTINLSMNLLFDKRYSFYATAIILLVSEFSIILVQYLFVYKKIKELRISIFNIKYIIGSLLMIPNLILWQSILSNVVFSILISTITSMLIYFVYLVLAKDEFIFEILNKFGVGKWIRKPNI